ncbi:MAG: nucleotidyl transferase AbiEii/AbiGii toxin family protein [Verrucomicrobia bacterium]|nr:nucleotidyl transferase AbiEii/AbiGii toxin family protein [Verrucomicrobiota bacterium]MBU1734017.1 nucleotidyl transferase AbiEii/AbiGii toxin family protein [Verrucomicrobiota bacterium]MBU1857113.1 nucleotidyl transferase AbiEii/AbiGii toxin family protein [Verrucomicrobiota bacterium]
MLEFAQRPSENRRDIFRQAGIQRTIGPHIIEKDFWVVWLLRMIFADPELGGHLVFKGGTSLSKAFGTIQRFSEDIDLSVAPDWLGFGGDLRLEASASRSQFEKRARALEDACITAVRDRFLPAMKRHVAANLPSHPESALTFEVDEATHSPVILFAYPREEQTGSLRPQVKLEFGSLYDQRPTGAHSIKSLTAEVFPALFREPSCQVVALEAERTFWEKATILHAEYHRPADKPLPIGVSRHYYDLYCLSLVAVGGRALADTKLLDRVRAHKQTYFRSCWAHYETAVPGSFHLLPFSERKPQIERDYRGMADMFMAAPPKFDQILAQLQIIERQINGA